VEQEEGPKKVIREIDAELRKGGGRGIGTFHLPSKRKEGAYYFYVKKLGEQGDSRTSERT